MDPLKDVSNDAQGIAAGFKKPGAKGADFFQTLKSLYAQVNREIKDADQKTEELAVGKRQDIHEVMIAAEKADLSFRFLVQVRNKLLDAYNEIMRMQF